MTAFERFEEQPLLDSELREKRKTPPAKLKSNVNTLSA